MFAPLGCFFCARNKEIALVTGETMIFFFFVIQYYLCICMLYKIQISWRTHCKQKINQDKENIQTTDSSNSHGRVTGNFVFEPL